MWPPEAFFSPERILRKTSRPERLPIDHSALAAAKLTSGESSLRACVSLGIEERARMSPRVRAASSRIAASLSSSACSTSGRMRFCDPAVPKATTASARRKELRLLAEAVRTSHAATDGDFALVAAGCACSSLWGSGVAAWRSADAGGVGEAGSDTLCADAVENARQSKTALLRMKPVADHRRWISKVIGA